MTGTDHAIEKAELLIRPILDAHAWVLDGVCACGLDLGAEHGKYQQARRAHSATSVARALADAGLLAPTPLREEWAVERPDPVDDQPRYDKFPTLEAALAERWSGDRAVRRLVTNWEGVDGDRDEMNRHNTVVLARDVAAAAAAGYPRHRWVVVTPQNITIAPRGMRARYVVAVDLSGAEVSEMLLHDSVAPAFIVDGRDPEVLHVSAEAQPE